MQWLLTIAGAAAVGTVVKFYTEKALRQFEEHRAERSLIELYLTLPRWMRIVLFVAFVMTAGVMFYSR